MCIYIYMYICIYCVYIYMYIFENPRNSKFSSILNLQSQYHWSLFSGTWQKRPRELDPRLRSEAGQMILHLQQACNRQQFRHTASNFRDSM